LYSKLMGCDTVIFTSSKIRVVRSLSLSTKAISLNDDSVHGCVQYRGKVQMLEIRREIFTFFS